MNADGSNQTRLTFNEDGDYSPAWPSDRALIAFSSRRDCNNEIYTMNADGSNQTRLTSDGAGDISPIWSPNGDLIAFTSGRRGYSDIYIMNADGSNQTLLTFRETNYGLAWSPDSTRIAVYSVRDQS